MPARPGVTAHPKSALILCSLAVDGDLTAVRQHHLRGGVPEVDVHRDDEPRGVVGHRPQDRLAVVGPSRRGLLRRGCVLVVPHGRPAPQQRGGGPEDAALPQGPQDAEAGLGVGALLGRLEQQHRPGVRLPGHHPAPHLHRLGHRLQAAAPGAAGHPGRGTGPGPRLGRRVRRAARSAPRGCPSAGRRRTCGAPPRPRPSRRRGRRAGTPGASGPRPVRARGAPGSSRRRRTRSRGPTASWPGGCCRCSRGSASGPRSSARRRGGGAR